MLIYDENDVLLDADTAASLVADGLGVLLPYAHVTSVEPEHFEIMLGTDGLRRLVPERQTTEAALRYHAYTAEELRPTALERVEAQALYTAMMTGTVLEDENV